MEVKKESQAVFITLIFILASFQSASAIGEDFTYDANGNMIYGPDGLYYEYNYANLLKRVREGGPTGEVIAEYWYDHTGKRKKKNESGVVTYYWFDNFEQIYYPNGTIVNVTYYIANGERLAKKVTTASGSKMYYFHPDHLGSTSVVSDEDGNLVEETEYYPYGGVKKGGEAEKYQFTGKELDKAIGLYYYGARYYSPELTRFTQPDTIIPDPYDPQTLNRYAYVKNNPLKYTDPTGNWGWLSSAVSTVSSYASRAVSWTASKISSSSTRAVSRVTSSSTYQTTSSIISSSSARSTFYSSVRSGGVSGARSYYSASGSSQRAASVISKGGSTQQQVTVGKQYVTSLGRLAAQTARNQAGASKANIGTFKHSQAKNLGQNVFKNPYFKHEQSFSGGVAGRGGSESVRLDVVQYNAKNDIVAVYDYKFGDVAGLTARRIAQIRSNLPPQYRSVPIYEIRIPASQIP